MPPAPVRVAPVEARPARATRTFVGTVRASRETLVSSEFAGLVVEVLAREGNRVEPSTPLARLRTTLLDLRIDGARAELTLQQERLRELENGSRPEEVRQARARVSQLEAELELRRWRLEANQRLFETKTISEDELRDARLAVEAAKLLVEAARAASDLVDAGPREEQVAQAQAQVAIQQAAISRLEEERRRYAIDAPFAGYVVEERAEVGQWIAAGGAVARIVALDEVDVVVPVVEDFVGRIARGSAVRVHVDAVPDRVFAGTVHAIVPAADERGRTFPVEIRLANPRVGDDVLLKAGMYASATFGVGEEETGLFVPKDALVLGGPEPLVWTVNREAGVAMPVPVTLGVAVDDLVQVKGALAPGTPVVVRGNERLLFPGQAVQVLD